MKKNSTPKVKALTIAEEREQIEKTGLLRLSWRKQDDNNVQVIPEAIYKALHALNKSGDTVTLMGCALPAKILREASALWGEYAVSIEAVRPSQNASPVAVVIRYKSTPDSRSVMTLKAVKEQSPNFLHPAFTDEAIPEAAKVDGWIAKACSKDEARPEMMKPYGQFAADGYRLHYDRRLSLELPRWDEEEHFYTANIEKMPARVSEVLTAASHVDNFALVDSAALLAAMKQAAKANKQTTALYVNGRIDVTTTAELDAESIIRSTITDGYSHLGDNVDLRISPKFVIDALSGMTGDVIIGISPLNGQNGRTLYISDGQREAVIMSKCA